MTNLPANYFSDFVDCMLIAEIGVNHNGDISLAKEMIEAAALAGADVVKFQTFTADTLATYETPKVRYQLEATGGDESHFEMLKKLELSLDDHFVLKECAEAFGVQFLSTPYDSQSAKFLQEELNVDLFKVASADIVDLDLHRYIASAGKPVIISTGMAKLAEIEPIVDLYRSAGNSDLVLLHCVSNYPCSDASLNLKVLNTLNQAFQLPVGYSDHSAGPVASVLAIAFGAKVIEKHFTIDKSLPGPDQSASASVDEFSELVQSVRRAEKMLGSPVKQCQEEEKQMSIVSRKSLYLARAMKLGERLQSSDIVFRRPGTGLSPDRAPEFIGKQVSADLAAGHQLSYSDLM